MTKRTVYVFKHFLAGAFIMLAAFLNVVQHADAVGIDVPPEERDALVALFNATDGNNWTTRTNWNSGDPCLNSWYGITCSFNHVTEVRLESNNLNGTIPAAIGNLSQLATFVAFDNHFLTGSIPRQFGSLSQLQGAHMGFCNLKGSIPPELENLSNLVWINLTCNSLSGSIPEWLGNLGKLTDLSVSCNSFTGPIPEQLGNLGQLTILRLNENQLCGMVPVALSNLTNLKDGSGLNINDNNLITDVQPPLFNVFLISKSNSFPQWQTTQNSKECFSWPQFLPAITGVNAH